MMKAPKSTPAPSSEGLRVEPVTAPRLSDVDTLFDTSGTTRGCYCMWHIVSSRECSAGWSGGNKQSFQSLTRAAEEPVGLLAYRDSEPVGWCAVGPRTRYARVLRGSTMKGRDADEDPSVWLVSCFYVHRTARRQGVMRNLLNAAVDLAREHGAVAVEGFPLSGEARRSTGEAFLGVEPLFASCGFTPVRRPSAARVIMRRELSGPTPRRRHLD